MRSTLAAQDLEPRLIRLERRAHAAYSGALLLPAARAVGDVTDAASVRRAMPREVDAVFHVAGDTSLWSKHDITCDCAKAIRELGLRPVPLREMVVDCTDWLATEGLLHRVESPGPGP